jgi:Predicted membrane protein
MLEALFTSTFLVTLGEIGDKTQLLALMLAARFRRPWIIVLGIFCATLFNHALAGLIGEWVRLYLHPDLLRWLLGLAFIGMGIWVLIPDKLDEPDELKNTAIPKTPLSVFIVTFATFFLAEMGDKTQLATIGLAARFDSLAAVIAGTTLGMMIADVPAVWIGSLAYKKLPIQLIHTIAAIFFVAIGVLVLYFGLPAQNTLSPQASSSGYAHPAHLGTLVQITSNSISTA